MEKRNYDTGSDSSENMVCEDLFKIKKRPYKPLFKIIFTFILYTNYASAQLSPPNVFFIYYLFGIKLPKLIRLSNHFFPIPYRPLKNCQRYFFLLRWRYHF